MPVEAEGKFAVLYEKWLSEAEDSEATREATDFLRERITKLGLEPSASYLSCRQSLCRMGVGFENFRDLHELNKIELPDGVQPEVTEPYLYGKTNVIVVYWSRKAAE